MLNINDEVIYDETISDADLFSHLDCVSPSVLN